eukprot:5660364-Pleurochrysis_carterae.AAC.1
MCPSDADRDPAARRYLILELGPDADDEIELLYSKELHLSAQVATTLGTGTAYAYPSASKAVLADSTW